MKHRQRMKNYYNYLNGNRRLGCEYCHNVSGPVLRAEDGEWVNASISISKERFQKKRKMVVQIKDWKTKEVIDEVFIPINYCFNCGRKLK